MCQRRDYWQASVIISNRCIYPQCHLRFIQGRLGWEKGNLLRFPDKNNGKNKLKVHLAPKYFFRSNKSLHLFETHYAFLPLFNPNVDFL